MTDAKNPDGPEVLDAEIVEVKGVPFAKGHDPRRGGFKPGLDPNRRTDNVGRLENLSFIKPGEARNPFGGLGKEGAKARKEFNETLVPLGPLARATIEAYLTGKDANGLAVDVDTDKQLALAMWLVERLGGKAVAMNVKAEPEDDAGTGAAPGEGRTMTVVFVDTAKKEGG